MPRTKSRALGGLFDLDELEESIADYEHQMSAPGFWDDNTQAQQIINQSNDAKSVFNDFTQLEIAAENVAIALEMYEELEDEDALQEAIAEAQSLKEHLEAFELTLLLSGEHDGLDAVVEIHPGAGGTESQDWASILYRMYRRWVEQHGFTLEVIDYHDGDEAGLKSVTFEVKGRNAYGLLKSERGIHRLVRISPFDSNNRRHTSFVSVEIMPMIDDTIEVDINPEDLRIDTYRSSGAGGQHVNVTDSAVRITHEPTGIVVQSQSQRSQLQNRETAMNLLRARLYQKEEEDRQKELAAIQGDQSDIGWGSQIRSYVFHPYAMVKDHRTDYEVGNAQGVVDGDLDSFIDAYLKWSLKDR